MTTRASAEEDSRLITGTFPEGFLFGMGTASYQCEGASTADGKGVSVWDTYMKENKDSLPNKETGDVALDSYHQYKQDVQMLKAIGATVYRFSLAWTRILPTGRTDNVNQAGIDYYNSLINELLANGIQPLVTLYHWDLPQSLQDIGGWMNEEIVDIFGEYARVCFKAFGDRVKKWTTVNEPFISGMASYYYGQFPPCEQDGEKAYIYAHYNLMAHANAYRIYEKEFKAAQGGLVGLSLDTSLYLPDDKESKDDMDAVHRAYVFRLGWMMEPLFHGRYPAEVREEIDRCSKEEGRDKSRLMEFTPEWSKKLKGSLDFLGVNYYHAEICKSKKSPGAAKATAEFGMGMPFFKPDLPGWNQDMQVLRTSDPNWERCGSGWQDFAPGGIRPVLRWIRDNYGNPPMMITETGCSVVEPTLEDPQREEYFKLSLNAVLKSIKEDGCNVVGYVGWSLLDVYEWIAGFSYGFGIVRVDRNDPNFPRSLKNSAKYLATIFKNHGFNEK